MIRTTVMSFLRAASMAEIGEICCFKNLSVEYSVIFFKFSSSGESPSGDPPKKRKHTRTTRHCHTQVSPEDIDQIELNPRVPSVPGENEPIPEGDAEANIPQCRFCLRRVAQNNLLVIVNKHKAKAVAAFKFKVFVNDAYPFACRNCLNLLDIFLDFRQTALKAKYLLLSERAHLESEGWDDPTLVETIANCKAAVEQNRKQIDAAYDAKLELEQQMENSKNEERYDAESTELSIEPMISFEPVEVTDAELYDETVEVLEEKVIKEEQYDINYEDEIDDTDYQPSADDEPLVKREPSIEVILKTPGKRGRKPKTDKAIKKEPRIRKPVKSKKPRNTDADKTNPKNGPHLCDLCGAKVCAQTIEAHRNRHLGIKQHNSFLSNLLINDSSCRFKAVQMPGHRVRVDLPQSPQPAASRAQGPRREWRPKPRVHHLWPVYTRSEGCAQVPHEAARHLGKELRLPDLRQRVHDALVFDSTFDHTLGRVPAQVSVLWKEVSPIVMLAILWFMVTHFFLCFQVQQQVEHENAREEHSREAERCSDGARSAGTANDQLCSIW